MIADINPSIITVTGRPCTPRDQGECVFVHKVYEVYKYIAHITDYNMPLTFNI